MQATLSRLILLIIIPCSTLMGCAPEPETTQATRAMTLAVKTVASEATIASTPFSTTEATLPATAAGNARSTCRNGSSATATRSYTADATLEWFTHTVHVEQTVTYQNTTTEPQDQIVMTVEPNQQPGNFILQGITDTSGAPLDDFVLVGARLNIPLPTALEPDCATTVRLSFDLTVPPVRQGFQWGRLGYLGYTERQVNLGMWLPLVAAYDEVKGWLTPISSTVGEHFVLETGDFEINLHVDNAPENLRVAGPGIITQPADHTWQVTLQGAREIALSLSAEYQQLNTTTVNGSAVELYYFPDTTGTLDAPRYALHTAADAITLFEELFGPYPYTRLTIVQGDFPDGMEFSGLVFVSDDWFRVWQGIPNDWLTLITVHEVAHQWWYARVGNDQGLNPYLDEALAIYSELLFIERFYPDQITWWWNFRINGYAPQGFVDASVSQFDSARSYINAIYLRGALMMAALRADLGDDAFYAWLRTYAAQMSGQIARPSDLWRLLDKQAYGNTSTTRSTFFEYAEIFPSAQATEIP